MLGWRLFISKGERGLRLDCWKVTQVLGYIACSVFLVPFLSVGIRVYEVMSQMEVFRLFGSSVWICLDALGATT